MACEGNGMSDARIGEALIKEVIEEELKDVPSEDIPPLTPLAVLKTDQEQKVVTQLAKMICIIGDKVQGDQEFKDAIDGITGSSRSKWDTFQAVADKVFQHGISWERIAVLFYVAGKLAVKINSFSELAVASMQNVSSLSYRNYSLALIFVTGLALGSIITWKLTKRF
ncbi:uncharacterized protein LOC116703331 isoform X2 [Etheostoma spectabile]|uniref:uncharacterized protein LOC116675297 isoform X2 n=1 Tax=Etheostoma spectabile TaxID=54343 RepID=UPI0013AF830A|nr:uncharacterized protein LOC116675297 isoform X2 [Etheostoma spectabile]XP_032393888.1 uncharacterized protein LOC116703331 isoform X2 [Etheostoma spectabile]